MTNIDAKIQEILLRSTPVNDNHTVNLYESTSLPESPSHCGLNIIGDRNIVINLSPIVVLACFILFYCLSNFSH